MNPQANGIGGYARKGGRKHNPNGAGSYAPEAAARMERVALADQRLQGRRQEEREQEAQSTQAGPAAPAETPRRLRGGLSLEERAGAACILGRNAYAFEFDAQGGEEVYGCYDAGTLEQKYALEAVGGIVTHCNCPDREYRRRTCEHMVELAVALQTGLRTPGGSVVRAASALSVLQAGPRTVADALRALRVDYQAEAARAVILTAAAVSRAAAEPDHRGGFA